VLTEKKLLKLLYETGAVLDGHFILSSGKHAGRYIQCAKVLEIPRRAELLGRELAARIDTEVDRVISPPLGGILIGYEVARALDRPFLFPERGVDGKLCLRRGFTLQADERVLIVEDVITTGRTTHEVLEILADCGATPVGVLAIVDRSSTHEVTDIPICSLVTLTFPIYEPEACPMCAQGLPAYRPGSRPSLAATH